MFPVGKEIILTWSTWRLSNDEHRAFHDDFLLHAEKNPVCHPTSKVAMYRQKMECYVFRKSLLLWKLSWPRWALHIHVPGGMWCWRSRWLVSSCSWRESGWQQRATLAPSSISTGLMGVNPRIVSFVLCCCGGSSFIFLWGPQLCRRLNRTNAVILV